MTDHQTFAAAQARRWYFTALLLTLGFKFWLARALPLTGDEAYFVNWGDYPDWGFLGFRP